jgi:hypothetical protein
VHDVHVRHVSELLELHPANAPDPAHATLITPGFLLANAINSATVLAGTVGLTIRTLGTSATSVTRAKSRWGLNRQVAKEGWIDRDRADAPGLFSITIC